MLVNSPSSPQNDPTKLWIFCSFTLDPHGSELQRFLDTLNRVRPKGATAELPDKYSRMEGLRASLKARGYNFHQLSYICTEFGDPTSRTRKALVARLHAPKDWEMEEVATCAKLSPLKSLLTEASKDLDFARWGEQNSVYPSKEKQREQDTEGAMLMYVFFAN